MNLNQKIALSNRLLLACIMISEKGRYSATFSSGPLINVFITDTQNPAYKFSANFFEINPEEHESLIEEVLWHLEGEHDE